MQNWFETKAKYVKIDQDGRERKVSETYLIDAVSFTDAETRITKELAQCIRGEFAVDDIKKSNVIEIFPSQSGEFWYKAKISIVTIDERAGKEKKINQYFLVSADDLDQALKHLNEGLSYILVPYSVTAIALSSVVDVFPYFQEPTESPKLVPIAHIDSIDEFSIPGVDNYPKLINGKYHYVLYPIMLDEKWRAAEVVKGGYISPFANPAKVEFDNEEHCQRSCDIHNEFCGWTPDEVENIISKSMKHS